MKGGRYLIAALILCAGLVRFLWPQTAVFLHGDAADYVLSVKKPWATQYLGVGSIGLSELLRQVLSTPRGELHLWDQFERAGDIIAARHFHVPLGLHPQAVVEALGLGLETHVVPAVVFAALSGAAVFLVLTAAGVRLWLAVAISVLFLSNASVLTAARSVSPHALFLLLCLASAGLFAIGGRRRAWLALGCAAAAVATLELSPLLIIGLLSAAVFHWYRGEAPELVRTVRERPVAAGLVVVGVLLAAWPAGLLRGGYVMSYGGFLYQGLFRRDDYFGSGTAWQGMLAAFEGNPMWPALTGALLLYGLWRIAAGRPALIWTVAWALMGLFFLQGVLNRFHNATYAMHFVAFLCVFTGLACEQVLSAEMPGWARAGVTGAMAVVFGVSVYQWIEGGRAQSAIWSGEARRMSAAMGALGESIPKGRTVLANQHWGPMKLYCPWLRFEPTLDKTTIAPRAEARLREPCWAVDMSVIPAANRGELFARFPGRQVGGFLIGCPDEGGVAKKPVTTDAN